MSTTNIIEIDGKKYKLIEVKDEPKPRRTGYERNFRNGYFAQDADGFIISHRDDDDYDDCIYNIGNYYTDEQLAQDNARADALMRRLRRFSAEGRKQKVDWKNYQQNKYVISYRYPDGRPSVDLMGVVRNLCPFFDSKEIAEAALDKYYDELMWYFTEYSDTAEVFE